MAPVPAGKEKPSAGAVTAVLLLHGAFLAACGCYGAASADWAPAAMHSAYAGGGTGAALVLCAIMAASQSYKLYMIGVHLALLLQLLLVGVFSWQAYRSYGVPAKADRFPLFVVMGVGSVVALAAMRAFKPKKAKKT
jgi:hypothetical protein